MVALTVVAAVFVLAGCSDDDGRPTPGPDDTGIQPNLYHYDGPSPGFATPVSPARP